MSRVASLLVLLIFSVQVAGCGSSKKAKSTDKSATASQKTQSTSPKLTKKEAQKGASEVLLVGFRGVVNDIERDRLYFYNRERLRIPFPEAAAEAKKQALEKGMEGMVDSFVRDLNITAAFAAVEGKDLWLSRIRNVPIENPRRLARGGNTAITDYLKAQTRDSLVVAMIPYVKGVKGTQDVAGLEQGVRPKLGKALIEYWKSLIQFYNKLTMLTGNEKIDMGEVNLYRYVAAQTVDRLFLLLAEREKQIRANPDTEDSDLIQRLLQTNR